jgi:hypothetical protein
MGRPRRPILIDAISVEAAEAGDYFQVIFEGAGDEENRPYLLLQRQFEDPEDEQCYLETGPATFAGHFRVRSAQLSRDEFKVNFAGAEFEAKAMLKKRIADYDDFCRILKIIVPEVEILG